MRGPASRISTFTPAAVSRSATNAPEMPAPTMMTSASITTPRRSRRCVLPVTRHTAADAHRLREGHCGPHVGVGVQHQALLLAVRDDARVPRGDKIVGDLVQATFADRRVETIDRRAR